MMKRLVKSMVGVTLLEIMLVLAIAAMVIVMSVRYYQSASSAQQANAVLEQIQAIVAAADSLAQATGSYANVVGNNEVKPLLPGGSMTTPWGDPITIGDVTSNSYSLDIGNVPSGVCPLLISKLKTNNHFSSSASGGALTTTCDVDSSTAVTIYYIANP
jgi:type II secretory pathway pseudopilin PulG